MQAKPYRPMGREITDEAVDAALAVLYRSEHMTAERLGDQRRLMREALEAAVPHMPERYRMAGWGDGGASLLTMLQDAARDGYPVLWFAEAMSPDLFTHAIDGQIADIVASDAADEMRRQVREYIKATRAPST